MLNTPVVHALLPHSLAVPALRRRSRSSPSSFGSSVCGKQTVGSGGIWGQANASTQRVHHSVILHIGGVSPGAAEKTDKETTLFLPAVETADINAP